MCGIGGVFAYNQNSCDDTLSIAIEIAQTLGHRGKNNCGVVGGMNPTNNNPHINGEHHGNDCR